jgi:hypothetical protein
MKRIICHWTAGGYKPNSVDKEHYHRLIDGEGNVHLCDNKISDNENTADGRYAAHTRGCNQGSIGVSLCCMMGAVEKPFKAGPSPMKEVQWKALVKLVAKLSKEYGIPVTPRTVLSHAEVQKTLGIPQKQKWDFTRLAFDPTIIGAKACGDKLRADVDAILEAS